MGRTSRGRLACLVAAIGLLLFPSWAMAQASRGQSAVPTPQQLNPTTLTPGPAAIDTVFAAPEPGPCPLRDSDLGFTLKSVEFFGNDGIKASKLAHAFDGMVGEKIKIGTVCDIRDRATSMLFKAGIFARVEIPSQRIVDGRLRLEVIEARIVAVHFHGDAGPAETKVEAYLEHLRALVPFDLDVAQRYLLLAREVPGVRVYAAIRPSAEGRGAVDLEITVSRKEVDAVANIQNFGSKTLGPWAGLARVDVSGLTPLGDRSSLMFYSTFDGNEQRVVQLSEEIRPGDQGIVLDASASYSTTNPGGDLANLDLNGDAIDAVFSISYPLIKKQSQNLGVSGGFEYVDEKTNLGTGGVLIDDRLRVLFAKAHADANGSIWGRAWEVGADLELRKGLDILDASQAGQVTLSHMGANPDAFVQRLGGHVTFRAFPLVELYVAATAQNADSPTLTFEQLAIGNLTFGRGYDPSSVAGDKGVAGSVEVRIGPFSPVRDLTIGAYGFFDAAYAKFIDQTGDATTIRSTGAGVRISYQQKYDLDILYAKPLNTINTTFTAPPPERMLMTLTVRY
jgi:hemolysin activation/secretion protein